MPTEILQTDYVTIDVNWIETQAISCDAFYLYVMLKAGIPMWKLSTITKTDLKKYLEWGSNYKLEKYMEELVKLQLIQIHQKNNSDRNPYRIIMPEDQPKQFCKMNTYTLNALVNIGMNIREHTMTHDFCIADKPSDYKEAIVRMCFLYIKNYNTKTKYIKPTTYDDITKITGLAGVWISSINNMLSSQNMLIKKTGKRKEDSFIRTGNKYIFIQLESDAPKFSMRKTLND